MKFKDLISGKVSLILFYDKLTLVDKPISELRDIAAYFGPDVNIIKVSKSDNEELCSALRVKTSLTYFIYSEGQMILRLENYRLENTLKEILLNLIQSKIH